MSLLHLALIIQLFGHYLADDTVDISVDAKGDTKTENEKEDSTTTTTTTTTSQPLSVRATFLSFYEDPVDVYWVEPNTRQGVFVGTIEQRGIPGMGLNTYIGHAFYFTPKGKP